MQSSVSNKTAGTVHLIRQIAKPTTDKCTNILAQHRKITAQILINKHTNTRNLMTFSSDVYQTIFDIH